MRNNYKEKKILNEKSPKSLEKYIMQNIMSRPISEGKPIYFFLFKGILLPFK